MVQTLWPPPSIPICQKQKNGIESIFVDKEAILSKSHRLPAANGKIGLIQASNQKDGRRSFLSSHVLRSEDPYTQAHAPETATQPLETESVILTRSPRSEREVWTNTSPHACFCSAVTHCVLARTTVVAPHHYSFLFRQVDALLEPCGL